MDQFFQKMIPSEQSQHQDQYQNYNLVKPNLANNQLELVGKGWNRWSYLFFDPQKNCIEPFERIGKNSVLQELDRHSTQCFQSYADSQRIR
jgi:hypothetical protein